MLLEYEFVIFLDDDVKIAYVDVERLFDLSEKNHLDLAQPALTADSATYFPDLKQPLAGCGIRPLTAVEIMAPVVSRRALETCGWTFAESISGWGVDLLLAAEVRRSFGKNRIALVSDVVAAHLRSVDTNEGALYKFLAAHGLDPHHELGRIAWKHAVSTEYPSIRFCEM